MKIKLIAVGRVKESYIREGIYEYLKRLEPLCDIEVQELRDEGIEKESSKIASLLDSDTYVMDEDGKEMTSSEFAKLMKNRTHINFVIGGPNGILKKMKANRISLSKMTFTHEMARLFMLEQIYRAFMINANRPYQK